MARWIFIFVDGLGLGDPDSTANPLRDPELSILANFLPRGWKPPEDGGRPPELPPVERLRPLPHRGAAVATDASLGLPGFPQSATGQTTLLTGVNAALVIDRHLYGYPSPSLRRLLEQHSILRRIHAAGQRPVFLNAFRPRFFELGDAVWDKPMSATSWANKGLPFLGIEDLRAGRAVYQDITHDSLRERGIDIEVREPEEAGAILARESAGYDFVLFEFFQTDKAGHQMDAEKARYELRKLERFLDGTLAGLDLESTTVVLTSDHGNIEDLSSKSHTCNPVPTFVFGLEAQATAGRLGRLESFTPVFLEALGIRKTLTVAGSERHET